MVRVLVIEKWLVLPDVNEPANQVHTFGSVDELCALLVKLVPRKASIDLGWMGDALAPAVHEVMTDRLALARASLEEEFPEWVEDERVWSFEPLAASRGEMRVRVWREMEPWTRVLAEALESAGGPRLSSVWPLAPSLLAKSPVSARKSVAVIWELPASLLYVAESKNGDLRMEWIGLNDVGAARQRLQAAEPSFAPAGETGVGQRGRVCLWIQTGWSGERAASLLNSGSVPARWTRFTLTELKRHLATSAVPNSLKLRDIRGGGAYLLSGSAAAAISFLLVAVGLFFWAQREEGFLARARASLEREIGQQRVQAVRVTDLGIEKANLEKLLSDALDALPTSPLGHFQKLAGTLPRDVSLNRLHLKGGKQLLVEARSWSPGLGGVSDAPEWAHRLKSELDLWIPRDAPRTVSHWDSQRGVVRIEAGLTRSQP